MEGKALVPSEQAGGSPGKEPSWFLEVTVILLGLGTESMNLLPQPISSNKV